MDMLHVAATDNSVEMVCENTNGEAFLNAMYNLLDRSGAYEKPSLVHINNNRGYILVKGFAHIHVDPAGDISWNLVPKYSGEAWCGWTSIQEIRDMVGSPNGEKE